MISTTTDGDVQVVTIDRPERPNALTRQGLADLEAAIDEANAPVVYLRGAGSAFCAGADLDGVKALDDREAAEAFAAQGQAVATAITESGPVIVADPRTVTDEIPANDADALRTLKTRLRDDADHETRERRERDAFGALWTDFER